MLGCDKASWRRPRPACPLQISLADSIRALWRSADFLAAGSVPPVSFNSQLAQPRQPEKAFL